MSITGGIKLLQTVDIGAHTTAAEIGLSWHLSCPLTLHSFKEDKLQVFIELVVKPFCKIWSLFQLLMEAIFDYCGPEERLIIAFH